MSIRPTYRASSSVTWGRCVVSHFDTPLGCFVFPVGLVVKLMMSARPTPRLPYSRQNNSGGRHFFLWKGGGRVVGEQCGRDRHTLSLHAVTTCAAGYRHSETTRQAQIRTMASASFAQNLPIVPPRTVYAFNSVRFAEMMFGIVVLTEHGEKKFIAVVWIWVRRPTLMSGCCMFGRR